MAFSTIREILLNSAEKYPDCDFVRYKVKKEEIETKTYSQLKKDSESFSNVLKSFGELNNHIGVIGMTSYSWLTAFFGIVNSGSVVVPLDVSLPAEEVCELVNRADVTVLVLDEVRKDVAEIIRDRCPNLKFIFSMQKEADDENALSLWRHIEKNEAEFDFIPDPDELCTIMFTSGTTGKSKGVMLTNRNLSENATCLDMHIPENQVVLSVLPIHHAYCLSMDILKAMSIGSAICINDSLMHVAKNIKLFKPNIILMVPLMIEVISKKLEAVKGLPPLIIKRKVFGKQLHTIFSGGAYLNPAYIDLFEKYGITILQGYGMTECSPVISTSVCDAIKKGSVGRLLPNCEAKSVDNELWVRGSSVMLGYYKMPEETKETLQDGWMKTGDLGYVDDEKFVFLTGRKKNLIITKNGENVSPEELENKIGDNRLVQEILVRENDGVIEAEIFPDYEYVQKKKIKDVNSELQSIIDEYNKTAPPYKKIYSLKVRETEFEKTPSKKIKRY